MENAQCMGNNQRVIKGSERATAAFDNPWPMGRLGPEKIRHRPYDARLQNGIM